MGRREGVRNPVGGEEPSVIFRVVYLRGGNSHCLQNLYQHFDACETPIRQTNYFQSEGAKIGVIVSPDPPLVPEISR